MTEKHMQREFIKKVCRGRHIVVSGYSSLIHGYGMECTTSTLNLSCYKDYQLEEHCKNFAESHGCLMEIVKDTPSALYVYIKSKILIAFRLLTDRMYHPDSVIVKSDVTYQKIDNVFSNMISLYSYGNSDKAEQAIEWILKTNKSQLSESSITMAQIFASQKGWDRLKELLGCEESS